MVNALEQSDHKKAAEKGEQGPESPDAVCPEMGVVAAGKTVKNNGSSTARKKYILQGKGLLPQVDQ